MIKLNRILDAYTGKNTSYYTCEKNIASMMAVERRIRSFDTKTTQITTFDGEKFEVFEMPDVILKMLKQDTNDKTDKV